MGSSGNKELDDIIISVEAGRPGGGDGDGKSSGLFLPLL